MVEGIATSLLCSVCDEVCKRGAQMKCCGTRACRSCAVLKINKIKKCWNEECGKDDIIAVNDLKNDDLLRKAVEYFLKNGKMDPAHEKMLRKTKDRKDEKKKVVKEEMKAPVNVIEKFNQPCRFGEKCKRIGCLFIHDEPTLNHKIEAAEVSENMTVKACTKVENCFKEKRKLAHPLSPESAKIKKGAKYRGSRKPCKFGAFCFKKDDCDFDHPKINKFCRFGAGCTNRSCTFDHSPSSKARAMSAINRGMKPMGGDLRFLISNRRAVSCGMGGRIDKMGGGMEFKEEIGGRMSSIRRRMSNMVKDNVWDDMGRRSTNLEQMLKMKEELESMIDNVMEAGWDGSGGGYGGWYGKGGSGGGGHIGNKSGGGEYRSSRSGGGGEYGGSRYGEGDYSGSRSGGGGYGGSRSGGGGNGSMRRSSDGMDGRVWSREVPMSRGHRGSSGRYNL